MRFVAGSTVARYVILGGTDVLATRMVGSVDSNDVDLSVDVVYYRTNRRHNMAMIYCDVTSPLVIVLTGTLYVNMLPSVIYYGVMSLMSDFNIGK